MSHFTVAVILKNDEIGNDFNKALTAALQPFHKYESTGEKDQYVVEVDKTEELEEEWNSMESVLKLSDGRIVSRYAEQFYHIDETAEGMDKVLNKKIFVMPEGAIEMEIPQHELSAIEGQSKVEFAKDYGGRHERDGRFYDWTNPNAQWDWWVVGGRWKGMLQLKPTAITGIAGRTGVMGTHYGEGSDGAMIKDIDFEAMEKFARARNMKSWAEYQASEKSKFDQYRYGIKPDDTQETYVERSCKFSTFAALKDGKWYEKGDMGWWGCVSDEKEPEKWRNEFQDVIKSCDPTDWLIIVDCHI